MAKNLVGLVARFNKPETLLKAVKSVKIKGYKKFDAHTPYAVHGLDDAMGLKPSVLGWIAAVGALGGGLSIFALQAYTSAVDYKIVVSGKPLLSFQAFVPITFEITILGAAIFTVLGMFALNQLPMLYHPLFHSDVIAQTGDDVFAISIDAKDPMFDSSETADTLKSLGADFVEHVYEGEESE
ncbi:DUF3341 domain-containing protein [bacterium]|nr:DUF3341 domain-containing protein [bacterium]